VSGKWLGLLSTKQAFSHHIFKISQFIVIVDQKKHLNIFFKNVIYIVFYIDLFIVQIPSQIC